MNNVHIPSTLLSVNSPGPRVSGLALSTPCHHTPKDGPCRTTSSMNIPFSVSTQSGAVEQGSHHHVTSQAGPANNQLCMDG
ncbi:hypothetical protein RRG08_019010 [Elysia crispata]|uniref:Uncharacterized protein n=1 Tax=Elysia crispata TaxID=231223 RepID=A0AAE1A521_9GAST|nr:hypothetical protein RRG08_019010 [Elysia crispata]